MNKLRLPRRILRPGLQRIPPFRLRLITYILLFWAILGFFLLGSRKEWLGPAPLEGILYDAAPRQIAFIPAPLGPRIPCRGARGKLLNESPDDELRPTQLDVPYPVPFIGSQDALGINKTWMTADGRFGPYGYNEEKSTHHRRKLNWDRVDWGSLQDKCLKRNADRFPHDLPSVQLAKGKKFSLLRDTELDPTPSWDDYSHTRRTAIVLRSYQGFKYTEETMWMVRSLITEASLRTGGEYAVILLVNYRSKGVDIYRSKKNYDVALAAAKIPKELRSITLLWDEALLKSWYPKATEHRTMWQVNQPLQLLALHHPEFDHFWQLEMDQRFMGDAGEYLDAMSDFARKEPRKQALERATFPYSEQLYSSYGDLLQQVDASNRGRSRAWGPLRISDIQPIGPVPPKETPEEDDFSWGVGEDADVVVTSFCANVITSRWIFKDWMQGHWNRGRKTPRWFCPPAMMRASRPLLLAIHADQHLRGLSIPSEAMLPSWALWHGMKISYPPHPSYMHPYDERRYKDRPIDERDEVSRLRSEWRYGKTPFFGLRPNETKDGIGHSDPQRFADKGLTFWWASTWPAKLMNIWTKNWVHDKTDLSSVFVVYDGEVYSPNFWMHPVK